MITKSKADIFKPKIFSVTKLERELCSIPVFVAKGLLDSKCKQAMLDEYHALVKNDTWQLVTYTVDKYVNSNKWVYRVKYKANGSLDNHKARLVAKGFQQIAGVDFFETFSPVIKPFTIRVVFTLAVTYG